VSNAVQYCSVLIIYRTRLYSCNKDRQDEEFSA